MRLFIGRHLAERLVPDECPVDVPVCDPNGCCESVSHNNGLGEVRLGAHGMTKSGSSQIPLLSM